MTKKAASLYFTPCRKRKQHVQQHRRRALTCRWKAPPTTAAVQKLLFGAEHPAVQQQRIATIQTIGGSGALKVGADFIKRYFPQSEAWISNPSWDNHRAIFEGAGIQVHDYPYYDADSGGLLFDDMLATLKQLPAQSVVLLHPCCHNPTGVDLSTAQWDALIPVLKDGNLLPFLDIAYQGLARAG
jgi:aromatic-amino-acid transaminase